MASIKVTGRLGDPAFLDSHQGLIACTVVGVVDGDLIVDFDDSEPLHWSGLTRNAWRGRKGERFSRHQIVPAKAVRQRYGSACATIRPYSWDV